MGGWEVRRSFSCSGMAQQACTVGCCCCWCAMTKVLLLLMMGVVLLLLREAGRILFEKHLPIARAVIGMSSSSSPSLPPFPSTGRLW